MTAYPLPKMTVPPDAKQTAEWLPSGLMRWGVISWLAQEHGWKRGVEVGCADARTTSRVLSACPKLTMWAVDAFEPMPGIDGPEDWADWPHAEHKRQAMTVQGRFKGRCSVIVADSFVAAQAFKDESLDFAFLDGDHSEAGVRADIETWLPKIRGGGMILGHDINWPSVRIVVETAFCGYWIGGNNVWGASIDRDQVQRLGRSRQAAGNP